MAGKKNPREDSPKKKTENEGKTLQQFSPMKVRKVDVQVIVYRDLILNVS